MSLGDRIKAYCHAKPGAVEDHPWGDTVFKVGGKMFAATGQKSVTVKSTPEKQAALIVDPAVTVAHYVGRFGWVTVELRRDTMKLAESLIDESYESVVAGLPKKARERLTSST